MAEPIIQFGEDTQRVLLAFMMGEPTLYALSWSIVKEEYFEDNLRAAVRYIQEYADKHSILPMAVQLQAATGVSIPHLEKIEEAHHEWYLKTVEEFCRFRAMENAILDGPTLLAKGESAEIEKRFRDALLISLTRDLGSTYFEDPLARIKRIRDNSTIVSTGWSSIDELLYGGFTEGSLNIFCGGSGSGKSLWMQNLALNWVEAGKNVVYITLELAEDLTDLRVDQMVAEMSRGELLANAEEAALRITRKSKDSGTLTTKKFSEAGTNANDIRAYIKEYTIQRGYAPDALLVDYLDLMYPNNARVDPSNLFVKDKYVAEELRAIAGDLKIPVVSASQLNRGSVQESEFDHSHIAGGVSKINTADNVFAILFTNAMREAGLYQLQFLKTRSAAAVGMKVEMKFNKTSLRIRDNTEITKKNDGNSIKQELRENIKKEETKPSLSQPQNTIVAEEKTNEQPSIMKSKIASLLDDIKGRS